MTFNQIVKSGGSRLLSMHKGSPIQLLRHFYPKHDWKATDRPSVIDGFWEDVGNQRTFMDELGKKLSMFYLAIIRF